MPRQIEVEIEKVDFADLLDDKKRKAAKEKLVRILADRMKEKLEKKRKEKKA